MYHCESRFRGSPAWMRYQRQGAGYSCKCQCQNDMPQQRHDEPCSHDSVGAVGWSAFHDTDIPYTHTDRHRQRQTDRHRHRQTHRQTDIDRDRQTDIDIDRHTDRQRPARKYQILLVEGRMTES